MCGDNAPVQLERFLVTCLTIVLVHLIEGYCYSIENTRKMVPICYRASSFLNLCQNNKQEQIQIKMQILFSIYYPNKS